MSRSINKPHAGSRLAKFVEKRILEMRPRKSQLQIAAEAGFRQANMMAMIKSGATQLPLDRVPALADALECDPAALFIMAVEQRDTALARVIKQIFGTHITKNEIAWLEEIRDASGNTEPHLTTRARKAIRGVFE